MSGIVGLVRTDGQPLDERLLEELNSLNAFRGPDAVSTWSDRVAGLGHTMLRTTDHARYERQPCSLDGRSWITADVRLDGRLDLIRKLKNAGEAVAPDATDPELLLHGWRAWGEGLTGHVIGDFAFAIWDKQRQSLFCARDHMGVKPFYYSATASDFVFSNTLRCVLAHPDVPSRVNEQAIGDFLLFASNQDLTTTTFEAIRMLPRAHWMAVSRAGVELHQYWTIPVPSEVRLADDRAYVEQFTELFAQAVSDRVTTDRISISMSGGLDSPAIAAFSKKNLQSRSAGASPLAVTIGHKGLDEEHFARLAANHLGIDIEVIQSTDYPWFAGWDHLNPQLPEPIDHPRLAVDTRYKEIASSFGRVVFTGYDGDSLLASSRNAYLGGIWQGRRFGHMAQSAWRFIKAKKRLPKWNTFTGVIRKPPAVDPFEGFPEWLNGDFEERAGLRERWKEIWTKPVPPEYNLRSDAYSFLSSTNWNHNFTTDDPGVTRRLLELRHPLADVRLIEFCMALPQVPWCLDKHVFRVAMSDTLPREIVTRPKTTVPKVHRESGSAHSAVATVFERSRRVSAFVDTGKVPLQSATGARETHWLHLRPLQLAHWLEVSLLGRL